MVENDPIGKDNTNHFKSIFNGFRNILKTNEW